MTLSQIAGLILTLAVILGGSWAGGAMLVDSYRNSDKGLVVGAVLVILFTILIGIWSLLALI